MVREDDCAAWRLLLASMVASSIEDLGNLERLFEASGLPGFAATAGSGKVGRNLQPFVAAADVRKVGGRIYAFAADSFKSCVCCAQQRSYAYILVVEALLIVYLSG
jgi:hypothetical protein